MSNYKKIFKRIFAVLIAVALAVPMFTTGLVKADENPPESDGKTYTQTLRIHKVLQEKSLHDLKGGDKEDYLIKGLPDLESQEIPNVNFKLYVAKDKDKSHTDYDESKLVGQVTTEKVGSGAYGELKLENFKSGWYVLVEDHANSSYIGPNGEVLTDMKAVPMKIKLPVRNSSGPITEPVNLYPKNIQNVPEVKKKSQVEESGDLDNTPKSVEIGDKVNYTVTTKIPAKSKLKTAKWVDTLTGGLKLNGSSIEIKINDVDKKSYFDVTPTEKNYIISLKDENMGEINNQDNDVMITITYSATVTADARASRPADNTVGFVYGNKPFTDLVPDNNPVPIDPTPEDPKNPKSGVIKVEKVWGDGTSKNLPGDVKEVVFTLIEFDSKEKKWSYKDEWVLKDDKTTHEFKELDVNKTYKVIEGKWDNSTGESTSSINGYISKYEKTGNSVKITNIKTDNPPPIIPPIVTVQTGGINIRKVNADTYNDLKKAYDNALKGSDEQAKKTALENLRGAYLNGAIFVVKNDAGKYLKAEGDNYTWVDQQSEATPYTTAARKEKDGVEAKGYVEINGLKPGKKYTIVETNAPTGFLLGSDNEIPIEITAEKFYETVLEENNKVIENKPVAIPETGGIGSIIFVVAGVALMGLAVYTINKKRKTN